LPKEMYIGFVRCSFTLCIYNKKPLFTSEEIVQLFNRILKEELQKQNIINWAYIYMPDHLHLVVEGTSDNSDLLKAINIFKQRTGYWLLKNMNPFRWQKNYYDYIHHKDEDLKKHIYYIFNNPVRKGMIENWEDYHFKGSLDFEINDIM